MVTFVAEKSCNRYYYGMKHEKMLSRAFNSIVVIVITVVISIAVFFVYRTFQKSVEADIFKYTQELEDSIHRLSSTEFRRFMFLIDLGKSVDDRNGYDGLRDRLERMDEIFGLEGEIPNLILSAGYYFHNTPDEAFEYTFKSGGWTELNDVFLKRNTGRDVEFFIAGAEQGEANVYLEADNPEGEFSVFFKIDYVGFIENYIKDVIVSANDNFIFEWIWINNIDSRMAFEDDLRNPNKNYHFKPVRIMTGRIPQEYPLYLEVPGPFDMKRFFSRNDPRAFVDKPEKTELPMFLAKGLVVKMNHLSGIYYYDIEYKAAVNFFETIAVFIILGILFILLAFQLQRTRMLRRKEKEFVASVTHELRTPLTVIRSAADNLKIGIINPEKLPVYAGLIVDQSERLGNMIEEILLYSRFEDKRKKPDTPVKMNLETIISGVKPLLDSLVSAKGLSLNWDTSALPESAVGYPEIIIIAVNNLVTNAVNHAYAEGSGEIRVRIRMLIPDRIEIVVEDDGRGIELREQKKIFEAFYRDSMSRQRQEKGSGLGLFLVRRKVMTTGGRLTVESPYRRINGSKPPGSRFTVILPCTTQKDYREESDG